MAEGERFELSIPCGMYAFQAYALGHYANHPPPTEDVWSTRRITNFLYLVNPHNNQTLIGVGVKPKDYKAREIRMCLADEYYRFEFILLGSPADQA